MAPAMKMQVAPAGQFGNWFSGTIESAKVKYRQYRKFRETLDELHALSERELQDIGLSRDMVRVIAREAAYGD